MVQPDIRKAIYKSTVAVFVTASPTGLRYFFASAICGIAIGHHIGTRWCTLNDFNGAIPVDAGPRLTQLIGRAVGIVSTFILQGFLTRNPGLPTV